jgi:hypothetical protein
MVNGVGEANRTLVSGLGSPQGMAKKPAFLGVCQEYILDKSRKNRDFSPPHHGLPFPYPG